MYPVLIEIDLELAELLEPYPTTEDYKNYHVGWQYSYTLPISNSKYYPRHFSVNLNDCHIAEREMEKLGLAEEYAYELERYVPKTHLTDNWKSHYIHKFNLINANAMQRRLAIISVLRRYARKTQ